MSSTKRILIVSNRLPVKIQDNDGELNYHNSEGGLATGLSSVYQQGDNIWIGWPGAVVTDNQKLKVMGALEERKLHPVFLTDEEVSDFYEGFSNETIWPLFHYFPSYAQFEPRYWDVYKSVNEKYAEIILNIATKDDVIWIHDYQLLLLPSLIRKKLPGVTIGFFQHIPFPSYEIFRLLPWRKEILCGILGADLVGFHTYDDTRHFIDSVTRILGNSAIANELMIEDRKVVIDAFPIGIDYEKFHKLSEDATVRRNERKLKKLINNNKLLISIDRLDYSKGILHRLKAFRLLLERYPDLKGNIRLIQLIVPSRDNVAQYKELKEEMNRMVTDINGDFGTFSWQPIHHFYRSFPVNLLSTLYKAADVALVTPMRDGMNLVCKEYVASKIDKKGVLVLSEMAGASRELSEALMVNPNDIWDFCEKIYAALEMPEAEQKRRMTSMQDVVSKFDVFTWVKNFTERLEEVKEQQLSLSTRIINFETRSKIAAQYQKAAKRLILLDYDGTLVPFQNNIYSAVPDAPLLNLLEKLCNDPLNKLVITSGRDYKTLNTWLGHLNAGMIAEHGAWYRTLDGQWHNRRDLNNDWRNEVYNVMDVYARRTPGSYIEEKSYSLVWHYRRVEEGLGELRARALMDDIKHFIADHGLQLLQGNKVIEIKSMAINKGKAAKRWLEKDDYDFIMAIGDDHTDEDTFKAMPSSAVTIKVGNSPSSAIYTLNSYKEVRNFLSVLANEEMPGEQNMLRKAIISDVRWPRN